MTRPHDTFALEFSLLSQAWVNHWKTSKKITKMPSKQDSEISGQPNYSKIGAITLSSSDPGVEG